MATVNTLNANPLKPVNPHLSTRPPAEAATKQFQPSFKVANTASLVGGKVVPGEPIEIPKNNWS